MICWKKCELEFDDQDSKGKLREMIKGIHHISMKCNADELHRVKDFYISVLGLHICREWADGIMIDTGNGLIEVFTNADGILLWPYG